VNLAFYLFFGLIGLLLFLFVWSLRRPKRNAARLPGWCIPEDIGRSHITFLPQIRQALTKEDYQFVSERASLEASRRIRRERRRVALAYLSALREEFERLLRMAKVIAVLSPEVAALQEFERLRLTVKFQWRYRVLWIGLWAGFASLPRMNDLSNLLSGLNVRLEEVMKELGERAALVAELASSPDRRRIHPI
jgi:hypothetical protein